MEFEGSFYDRAGLARWLGITGVEIDRRVSDLDVLGLHTGDGEWVYPAWQFSADGQVHPDLPGILRALAAGTADRWTWLLWLTSPGRDGRPAHEALLDGPSASDLRAEARSDAARWAS